MLPQLNALFCFQLLQTSLKALGRLMVVLLDTETSGFFQNIVHVSTRGAREKAWRLSMAETEIWGLRG